jgi:hypothetical protein
MEIAIETALGLALFVPLAAVAQPRTSAPAGAWAGINGDNVVDVHGNLCWWMRPRREARGKKCGQSLESCSSPSRTRQLRKWIG